MRTGKNIDKLVGVYEALCKALANAHERESEQEEVVWEQINDLAKRLEEYLWPVTKPEETEPIKTLLEELADGKCPGVKGATAYKIQKYAAEKGYV
ncbi:MAG: hypothetical protein J6Y20_01220 [Lachnospiraceae bacterium]|nr:hypothetical protein [Lachnospiraceae bacterium]